MVSGGPNILLPGGVKARKTLFLLKNEKIFGLKLLQTIFQGGLKPPLTPPLDHPCLNLPFRSMHFRSVPSNVFLSKCNSDLSRSEYFWTNAFNVYAVGAHAAREMPYTAKNFDDVITKNLMIPLLLIHAPKICWYCHQKLLSPKKCWLYHLNKISRFKPINKLILMMQSSNFWWLMI